MRIIMESALQPGFMSNDLHCSECGEEIAGDGGNNASLKTCKTNAKAHFKATGHAKFTGTSFFWIDIQ